MPGLLCRPRWSSAEEVGGGAVAGVCGRARTVSDHLPGGAAVLGEQIRRTVKAWNVAMLQRLVGEDDYCTVAPAVLGCWGEVRRLEASAMVVPEA